VARRLPYPHPLPEAPAPPLVACPRHLPYTLAHAAPADARHQHGILWHYPTPQNNTTLPYALSGR